MPRDVHHLEPKASPELGQPEPKLRPQKTIKPVAPAQPSAPASHPQPFWKAKQPEAMTVAEWESLCDGCGRCCLIKLEDEDTGEIHYTDVGCRLLDGMTCGCSDYRRRRQRVRDCLRLTPELVKTLSWLPPTCGYRLVMGGQDLPWWHPLVSGSRESVHEAGISVRGKVAASETEVKLADYPDYMVSWPKKVPEQAKNPKRVRKVKSKV